MKLLLEIRDSDIFSDSQDLDPSNFSERLAARAIVSNTMGQIALLRAGNHNYHKLPGGGVEGEEDIKEALRRELLEEIGCKVQITGELGEIVEYKSEQLKKQTSYCFVGHQVGETKAPDFTEKELADGFEIVWCADIDKAIGLLENDSPTDYTGHFIRVRDLAFLKAAKSSEDI